jgi:hypothetical protein
MLEVWIITEPTMFGKLIIHSVYYDEREAREAMFEGTTLYGPYPVR